MLHQLHGDTQQDDSERISALERQNEELARRVEVLETALAAIAGAAGTITLPR
jgi:hypothetical protein